MGLKQDQEARWGMDELVKNVPRGLHLALQFKSPKPTPLDSQPYAFTINDQQNRRLLRLGRVRPNGVYYVFPHYNTLSRLGNDSPILLNDTWFLRVVDLTGLQQASVGLGVKSLFVTLAPIRGVSIQRRELRSALEKAP